MRVVGEVRCRRLRGRLELRPAGGSSSGGGSSGAAGPRATAAGAKAVAVLGAVVGVVAL